MHQRWMKMVLKWWNLERRNNIVIALICYFLYLIFLKSFQNRCTCSKCWDKWLHWSNIHCQYSQDSPQDYLLHQLHRFLKLNQVLTILDIKCLQLERFWVKSKWRSCRKILSLINMQKKLHNFRSKLTSKFNKLQCYITFV